MLLMGKRRMLTENQPEKERDFNGRAPIHWAAMKGHVQIVQLLEPDLDLEDIFG